MKLLQKIKSIFAAYTRYPTQQLTDKQFKLIEEIDARLIVAHTGKYDGSMNVRFTGVSFMSTMLSLDSILSNIKLDTGTGYIPRSVALTVDANGNWLITYALRETASSDQLVCALFTACLNATNQARAVHVCSSEDGE